jgi:hypothetical protein
MWISGVLFYPQHQQSAQHKVLSDTGGMGACAHSKVHWGWEQGSINDLSDLLSLPPSITAARRAQRRMQMKRKRKGTTSPPIPEAPPAMPVVPKPWMAEAAWHLSLASPASHVGWLRTTAPLAPHTAPPFTYGQPTWCPMGVEVRGSPLLPHTTKREDPHPSNWQRPRVTR